MYELGFLGTIETVYKFVLKPYNEYNYYLSYKGDLIIAKAIEKKEIVGKTRIFDYSA